jgi:hypothetical protein
MRTPGASRRRGGHRGISLFQSGLSFLPLASRLRLWHEEDRPISPCCLAASGVLSFHITGFVGGGFTTISPIGSSGYRSNVSAGQASTPIIARTVLDFVWRHVSRTFLNQVSAPDGAFDGDTPVGVHSHSGRAGRFFA